MDLKKLPPSMLMALGLGCVAEPCLSSTGLEPTETSTSGPGNSQEVGPCLSPPSDDDPLTDEGEVGPCLGIPDPTTGASSSGSTGADSGTTGTGTTGTGTTGGTDSSGTDSGSSDSGATTEIGPCLVPPGIEPDDGPLAQAPAGPPAPSSDRAAALGRVLERGTLPADIAARLRRGLDSES